MKLGEILFISFSAIIIGLVNWVFISAGMDLISKPSTAFGWVGVILILIAVFVDIMALYRLITIINERLD